MNNNSDNSEWISFSDIMTGLMLVFLLIALIMMVETEDRYTEIDRQNIEIKAQNTRIKKQYAEIDKLVIENQERTRQEEDLLVELREELGSIEHEIEIDILDDMTVRFRNVDVLFDVHDYNITPEFQRRLSKFLPKYFSILNKPKYADFIKEVKISGYTGNVISWRDPRTRHLYDPRYDTEIELVKLSQERGYSVLNYIINQDVSYNSLPDTDKDKFKKWFGVVGYGKWRPIEGLSGNEPSNRRVEFKITTLKSDITYEILKLK